MRFLTLLTLILAFLWLPATASAQILACTGVDCNFCSLVTTIDNIIDFVIQLAVVLATIMLAITGFKMVASKGNPGAMQAAKDLLMNICIGVLLILAAWTLVDTLMKLLVSDQIVAQYGPWYDIDGSRCGSMLAPGNVNTTFETPGVSENLVNLDREGDGTVAITVVNQYGPGGTFGLEGGETAPVAGDADGSFTFDAGIQAQMAHASPALRNTLNCMARRLPANVGRVSSISDSRIVSGSNTFAGCVQGGCAHTSGSRHYGGYSYTGSSYAVDFGDEENVGTLCTAANACGNVHSCSVHNGNHVHMQLRYPNGT